MAKNETPLRTIQLSAYYDAVATTNDADYGSFLSIAEDYYFAGPQRAIALGRLRREARNNPYLAGPEGTYMGAKPFSEATAQAIDAEVSRIIAESHADALRLLGEHRKALDALAKALLARETLNEEEILEVTGITPVRDPEPSAATAGTAAGAAVAPD